MNESKERAELVYGLYASYLGSDLGQPLEPWVKLPELVRGAWRFTVSQLLGLQPVMAQHPLGPNRAWGYSNSNYHWQVANNLDELKALPWVTFITDRIGVSYKFSISTDAIIRAPWDRAIGLKALMLEYDDGYKWMVLGGLENPEMYGLPDWVAKYRG